VVTPLPKLFLAATGFVNAQGTALLGLAHHIRKRCVIEVKQPVKVVWHDHPGEGVHQTRVMGSLEFSD
jgi:hypothetical protein